MAISDNIRNLRKENGYTQKQLAELSGIATITLQQYESGKREPKIEQLIKLSNALQVDINELLEDSDSLMLHAMKRTNSPLLDNIDIELINNFHKLNDSGQKRLIEYLSELLKILDYTEDTT